MAAWLVGWSGSLSDDQHCLVSLVNIMVVWKKLGKLSQLLGLNSVECWDISMIEKRYRYKKERRGKR